MKKNQTKSNQNPITITNRDLLTVLQSLLTTMPAENWYSDLLPCAFMGFYSYAVRISTNTSGPLELQCSFRSDGSNPIFSQPYGPVSTTSLDAASTIGIFLENWEQSPLAGLLDGPLQVLQTIGSNTNCVNPTIIQSLTNALNPIGKCPYGVSQGYGAALLAMSVTINVIAKVTTYPLGSIGAMIQSITSDIIESNSLLQNSACTQNDAPCFEQYFLGIYLVLSAILSLPDTNSYDGDWFRDGGYRDIIFAPLYNYFGVNPFSTTLTPLYEYMSTILSAFSFVIMQFTSFFNNTPEDIQNVLTDLQTLIAELGANNMSGAENKWQHILMNMGYLK